MDADPLNVGCPVSPWSYFTFPISPITLVDAYVIPTAPERPCRGLDISGPATHMYSHFVGVQDLRLKISVDAEKWRPFVPADVPVLGAGDEKGMEDRLAPIAEFASRCVRELLEIPDLNERNE